MEVEFVSVLLNLALALLLLLAVNSFSKSNHPHSIFHSFLGASHQYYRKFSGSSLAEILSSLLWMEQSYEIAMHHVFV